MNHLPRHRCDMRSPRPMLPASFIQNMHARMRNVNCLVNRVNIVSTCETKPTENSKKSLRAFPFSLWFFNFLSLGNLPRPPLPSCQARICTSVTCQLKSRNATPKVVLLFAELSLDVHNICGGRKYLLFGHPT